MCGGLNCQSGVSGAVWGKQERDWIALSQQEVFSRTVTGAWSNEYWIDLRPYIPEWASEVSLSFYLESGNVNCDGWRDFYIKGFSKQGEVYRMTRAHLYHQNSWAFTNAAIELPTINKWLTVRHPDMCTSNGGDTFIALYLTGYR